jgi:hypothetical protein
MTVFAQFKPCRHCRRTPSVTTINGWLFAQCPCGQGVSLRTHNEAELAEVWNHANRIPAPITAIHPRTLHV